MTSAKASATNGSPFLLVVTPSALTAVELVRALSKFKEYGTVAKLFARHIKVEEQIRVLRSQRVLIGVGTPNRLLKLVQEGALQLDRVEGLILDAGKDKSNRSFFDLKEIRTDFFEFFERFCLPFVKSARMKITFY